MLHAEDVPLSKVAADVGTPFYCYSTATITRHYLVFREALAGIDLNAEAAVVEAVGDATLAAAV